MTATPNGVGELRCAACNRSMLTAAVTISKVNYGPKCAAKMGLSAPKVARPKRGTRTRRAKRSKGRRGDDQLQLFGELQS